MTCSTLGTNKHQRKAQARQEALNAELRRAADHVIHIAEEFIT